MEIRALHQEELVPVSLRLQAYAFYPTPASDSVTAAIAGSQRFYAGNLALVVFDDQPGLHEE